MMPAQDDMAYTDPTEEKDKEWFKSFPDPAWYYAKLQEAADLKEKAAAYSDEKQNAVRWLKEQWGNGYWIYTVFLFS
jgi:hypothetical protein